MSPERSPEGSRASFREESTSYNKLLAFRRQTQDDARFRSEFLAKINGARHTLASMPQVLEESDGLNETS